jgi:thiol-disulfide isomerase/thioredoxin
MIFFLLAALTVPLQWNRTVVEPASPPPGVTVESHPVADGFKLMFHSEAGPVDPTSLIIVPGGSAAIEISRRPYVLQHNTATGRIDWFTHYRAEGILHISPCQTQIIATDSNGDGIFDTINLGKTFQLCGHQLAVKSIAPDGASVTFEVSRIVPRIGQPIPQFTLTTTAGTTISSLDLKGKPTLLDFWATWCDTCVREMPELTKLNLNIISINIDSPGHLPKSLPPWTQVVSGIGTADSTWQIFQSLSKDGSLPLYVLIDENGIIRHAGPTLPARE